MVARRQLLNLVTLAMLCASGARGLGCSTTLKAVMATSIAAATSGVDDMWNETDSPDPAAVDSATPDADEAVGTPQDEANSANTTAAATTTFGAGEQQSTHQGASAGFLSVAESNPVNLNGSTTTGLPTTTTHAADEAGTGSSESTFGQSGVGASTGGDADVLAMVSFVDTGLAASATFDGLWSRNASDDATTTTTLGQSAQGNSTDGDAGDATTTLGRSDPSNSAEHESVVSTTTASTTSSLTASSEVNTAKGLARRSAAGGGTMSSQTDLENFTSATTSMTASFRADEQEGNETHHEDATTTHHIFMVVDGSPGQWSCLGAARVWLLLAAGLCGGQAGALPF